VPEQPVPCDTCGAPATEFGGFRLPDGTDEIIEAYCDTHVPQDPTKGQPDAC